MYRTLRLCAQGGGYEAVPERARPLDLAAVRRRLEAEGVAVVDARVMLIAALETEVTISRNARLLFKTPDATVAERTFVRLLPLLGAAGERAPGLERRSARA